MAAARKNASLRRVLAGVLALFLTAALAVVYFGSRKVVKNGMPPILLIVLAAVAGALVYGFA